LEKALEMFHIDVGYGDTEKEDMRTLILSQTEYDADEMELIRTYCEKDVLGLPKLLGKIYRVFSTDTSYSKEQIHAMQMLHGEYLIRVAWADYHNKGFPVSVERLDDIYGNMADVKAKIAKKCNEKYCSMFDLPIYRETRKTKLSLPRWSFNMAGFIDFLKRKDLYEQWDKTDTGLPSTKSDIFLDRVRGAPYMSLMYRTRKTFQDLNDKRDLREWEVDGYIKAKEDDFWFSRPFGTKTSRSSPLPAKGFLLNKTPWLRCALIEPHEGMCFVGADWSAQEIAIAAALSKDENMRDLYMQKLEGGDIYIFMAKKAGVVPDDATPKSHPKERGMFKIVQLGISYGKGIASLGDDIYNASLDADGKPTISIKEALARAEEIYKWHKSHFQVFWNWVDWHIQKTKKNSYQVSVDGWISFLSSETNKRTQQQNFPIQTTAAAMMRRAMIYLVDEGVDVVCSHHDAFYLNCKEEDAESVREILEDCMNRAAVDTIGDFCPVVCDSKVYHHGEFYKDERGEEQLKEIGSLFGWDY
jgi:hypothetical protein